MLARRHCRRSRQEIKCCFGTAAIVSLRKLAAVHPNYRTKARTKDDAVAEQFFQQAIDLDPMFVGGYIGLSAVLSRAKGTQAREELAKACGRARQRQRRSACPPCSALNARGDHQGARAQAERALALCPNLAAGQGALGVILAYSARPKEGLAARLPGHDCRICLKPGTLRMGRE
jgi:tetratricopeptide (TPR) repeat protein